ncbi:triose-phosphate isomerase [Chloroflexota bacterium]
MRIPMIAGNWKMNTTVKEAIRLVEEMHPGLDGIYGVEKVVCPPFISLTSVKAIIKDSTIKLGAQNLYFKESGAYTGEISPLMLSELCEYVIIGHSERRHIFGETSEIVNKKVIAALQAGLKPILCVGEILEENEAGRTEEVVTNQVKVALNGISNIDTLIVAYEPVWAIGTGKAATSVLANETIGFIRSTIAGLYGREIGQNIRILYGGSVTAENIVEYMRQPDIDGGLIGGASLKTEQFFSIIKQTSEII